MLNGHLYVTKTQYGALRIADFSTDSGSLIQTSKYKFPAELSLRNTAFTSWAVVDSSLSLVNYFANDVDAAVIPNEPTHEVTVSGWGYILGSNVGFITEDVQLPYTFNNIPNITVSPGGAYAVASGTPTSLESCNLAIGGSTTATGWRRRTR